MPSGITFSFFFSYTGFQSKRGGSMLHVAWQWNRESSYSLRLNNTFRRRNFLKKNLFSIVQTHLRVSHFLNKMDSALKVNANGSKVQAPGRCMRTNTYRNSISGIANFSLSKKGNFTLFRFGITVKRRFWNYLRSHSSWVADHLS